MPGQRLETLGASTHGHHVPQAFRGASKRIPLLSVICQRGRVASHELPASRAHSPVEQGRKRFRFSRTRKESLSYARGSTTNATQRRCTHARRANLLARNREYCVPVACNRAPRSTCCIDTLLRASAHRSSYLHSLARTIYMAKNASPGPP